MKTFDLANDKNNKKINLFIFSDEMAAFAQANRLVYFDSVKGESGAANYTSGDNCGYIYSSSTVENSADDFFLKAGDSVLVVPRQPEDYGPWPVLSRHWSRHRVCPRVSPDSHGQLHSAKPYEPKPWVC